MTVLSINYHIYCGATDGQIPTWQVIVPSNHGFMYNQHPASLAKL